MEHTVDGRFGGTSATPFSLPDSDQLLAGADQEAVFVIGAPRSGTTLLYKILCLHPETSWVSNYLRRMPRLPAVGALSRATAKPDARLSAWFGDGQAYRYGSQRKLREWAFPSPVEGEPFFALCGFTADGSRSGIARVEQKRRLLEQVRSLCKAQGGDLFVSKRIAHNQRLPLLGEALPKARFIHLVRDGRSVAKSLRNVDWWPESYLPWFGGSPTDWLEEGRDPWHAAALHWVHELADIERGFSQVDSSRILQLSYEELLAAPIDQLERLANFAGLEVTETMNEAASTLRPSSGGSGLDASTQLIIDEIQHDTLLKYGYESTA